MILLNLFTTFFKIGLFAIGGAYSFLPLLEKEVVEKHGWLAQEEFLEILGLIKIFPGAISIKYATYTGYKVAGFGGALVANLGNFLAPVALILIFGSLYLKHKDVPAVKNSMAAVQWVAIAMILAVAIKLTSFEELKNPKIFGLVAVAFLLFLFTKIHPAFIIIAGGVFGVFFY